MFGSSGPELRLFATTKMARRQRKTSPIPTARISEVFTSSDELEEEISEDEKRRLIEQSGILGIVDVQKVTTSKSPAPVENAPDFADEVFYATLLLIPMAFLYVIMDMCVPTARGYAY